VAVVLICGFFFKIKWSVENDVLAPLNRAQVAAQADDMLLWLEKVERGMQRRGMTEGYATIFKHTSDYDYAAIYKSLENIIGRLNVTVEMDRASPAYQMAMNDHRGNLRELEVWTSEYTWKYWGWWWFTLTCAFFALAVTFGAYALTEDAVSCLFGLAAFAISMFVAFCIQLQ
jgi:23S rRNA maturation mini-RNase III